jgi:hypothetical protein
MRVRRLGNGLLAVALALLLTERGPVDAAPIIWGPATNVAGDTDVSTDGTLIAAFNTGGPDITATTINGVTFAKLSLSGNVFTFGNFRFTHNNPNPSFLFNDHVGSSSPPFSNLSASYQTLLSSFTGGAPFNLTMSGLTLGREYEFEWWTNISSSSATGLITTATAGNNVGLNANTTGLVGGDGQFAIGSFLADGPSETIAFTGGPLTFFDGFELRGSAVPEPSSLALLALGGTAVACRRRWRNRNPKPEPGR